MSLAQDLITEITNLIQPNLKQPKSIVCVFDLDSTLFDVSTRTQKIIHEFIHEWDQLPNTAPLDPAFKAAALNVTVQQKDWGLKEAFERHGFTFEDHPEFHKNLFQYWQKHFFSNTHPHYDIPTAGAISFVLKLHEAGAKIYYLTGRDVARMGIGTLDVLQKWGFPIDPKQVLLKPDKNWEDKIFKKDQLQLISQENPNSLVYFFDNEPVIVNFVHDELPHIQQIYLDTTHSRKQMVNNQIRGMKCFT